MRDNICKLKSDMGLIFRICKEQKQLNNDTNNPIKNWKMTRRDISQKKNISQMCSTCLHPQHSGGRGRRSISLRPPWATQRNPISNKQTNKVSRYMKMYSMSLMTREMQIKITMRYDLTSVRIAFIKRTSDKYS
jgi:hypothetical protein